MTKMLGASLVIVNLQKTVMDDMADLVINAKLDDFAALLMKKMELRIPAFKLERWVELELEETKSGKEILHLNGITEAGNPFDLFRSVSIND